MFETVRLNARGLARNRDTGRCSGVGIRLTDRTTSSAPCGSPARLRCDVSACTRCSRRAGSGSSHGRSTNMNEIRLPSSPASPRSRTLTGTIALSAIGVSPCRLRRRLIAPDEAARMTSFSFVPNAVLIPRSSSRGRETCARWRRGEFATLSGSTGVAGRAEPMTARTACPARSAISASRPGELAIRAATPTSSSGRRARSSIPSATSRAGTGSGRGFHSSSSAGGGSGWGSSSSDPSSTAAIPSTMQWWALPTSPMRPSSSRGAIDICHRGRSRGSGSEVDCSTTSPSRSLAAGTTCRSTSNAGSSVHTGVLSPSGTRRIICR